MIRFLTTGLLLILLIACQQQTAGNAEQAADARTSTTGSVMPQKLVVVTRNAPTTWYQGRDGVEGPEHDLVRSFAKYHSLKYEFRQVDSISELLQTLQKGEADLAAAGLTDTEKRRSEGLQFGPQYQQVQQQVVCRRGSSPVPDNIEQLIGKTIRIIADSSYSERLHELKTEYPKLRWQEVEDSDTEQLLEQVWRKQFDCAVADSNIVSINRRYFPELRVAFPLSEPQSLAWIINPRWSGLEDAIETWLQAVEQTGELAAIMDKYYGHVELFDYVDMRKFISRIKERLPAYQKWFKQYAKKYNLDWTLLAAQSYQESHWKRTAKSPTGVRGLMMLTQATAKQMAVTDRLDAAQSIQGGARYLARMIERVPETVHGEDRLWFALAAYNVGFGHLRDARTLAKQLGKNPNRWVDLKEVLPLLSQKKYYKKLKYGYARGNEPVRYVQRIKDYQQVLNRQLK